MKHHIFNCAIRYSLIVCLLVVTTTACTNENKEQQTASPIQLNVVEIPTRDITSYQRYTATIEGFNSIAVRSKAQGYIEKVYISEGQAVKKGQALFGLETNVLTQESHGAQSALQSAEAAVRVAQVEVSKLIPLVESNIVGAVRLETAQALLAQAIAHQNQAEYQQNSINANIDYAVVRSPINGVIGVLPLKIGSLVGPVDATPLTTVSDVSKVYANFSMNEKEYFKLLGASTSGKTQAQRLENFPPVGLLLADGSIYSEEGTIETIAGIVDANTGAVQFRAIFPNPDGLLNTGNSGSVMIPKIYKDALIVPANTTFELQGIVYTYKVENDTTRATIIRVLDRIDNILIVEGGLKSGDKIVAEGLGFVRDKTPITPNIIPIDSVLNGLKPVFK